MSNSGDEAKMETKSNWEEGNREFKEEGSREFQEGERRQHCAKERLSTMRNEKRTLKLCRKAVIGDPAINHCS